MNKNQKVLKPGDKCKAFTEEDNLSGQTPKFLEATVVKNFGPILLGQLCLIHFEGDSRGVNFIRSVYDHLQ